MGREISAKTEPRADERPKQQLTIRFAISDDEHGEQTARRQLSVLIAICGLSTLPASSFPLRDRGLAGDAIFCAAFFGAPAFFRGALCMGPFLIFQTFSTLLAAPRA